MWTVADKRFSYYDLKGQHDAEEGDQCTGEKGIQDGE